MTFANQNGKPIRFKVGLRPTITFLASMAAYEREARFPKDLIMSTAKQEFSRHVSVPSDEGVRVDQAITIEKPVSEVYAFWRRFENLPRFMRHLESVTVKDDLHSHWVLSSLGGKKLEWDAEIIEQRDNEMISWRSAPGADIDN